MVPIGKPLKTQRKIIWWPQMWGVCRECDNLPAGIAASISVIG
jgi:hypothetical protein